MADFNENYYKVACYIASNWGGGDKGENVSSIIEAKLAINICAANYYEDVERSIEPNNI